MKLSKQVIHFDGDDVGDHIELFLLDGKLEEAAQLSQKLTLAIQQLKQSLENITGVEIRLCGGDDLIMTASANSISKQLINRLRSDFEITSGLSVSVGAGSSVQEALLNLRRAKLSGKNRLVGNLIK